MYKVTTILTAGAGLLFAGLATAGFPNNASAATNGKAIFEKNCSVCHSIAPPPKSAPPILPLSARYHQRFSSRTEGIRHMAEFITAPAKEKVMADQQAITRFGMMPPIPISKADAMTVAAWVWDQNSGGVRGQGMGPGRGNGQGNCNQP